MHPHKRQHTDTRQWGPYRPLTQEQMDCLQLMRDEGLDTIASAALRAWEEGRTYHMDTRVPASRALRHALKNGNVDALSPIPEA